jgi:hypothetical protein
LAGAQVGGDFVGQIRGELSKIVVAIIDSRETGIGYKILLIVWICRSIVLGVTVRVLVGLAFVRYTEVHQGGKVTSDPIPPNCYTGDAKMTSPLPTHRDLAAPRPMQK